MGAKGIVIAEECHVVNILPPVDITGGVLSDIWGMENYGHCTIIIQIGASAAAFTKIILNKGTTFVTGSGVAMAHTIYKEETTTGDTLGAATAVLAAGTTPSATDSIMYVIEVDAAELGDGYTTLELSLTNGANSVIASAVAILSGSRYAGDQSATALA